MIVTRTSRSISFKSSTLDSVTWISCDGNLGSTIGDSINFSFSLAKDLVRTLASLAKYCSRTLNCADLIFWEEEKGFFFFLVFSWQRFDSGKRFWGRQTNLMSRLSRQPSWRGRLLHSVCLFYLMLMMRRRRWLAFMILRVRRWFISLLFYLQISSFPRAWMTNMLLGRHPFKTPCYKELIPRLSFLVQLKLNKNLNEPTMIYVLRKG